MANSPAVTVCDPTADNIEAVLDLDVQPEQLRWVRPVAWYVARSAYEDNEAARRTYRSLGFAETRERQEDELVMLLGADVPQPGRC